MLPIPLERLAEALFELDFGAPPSQLAQLGRVDELAIDLAIGVPLTLEVGLDAPTRRRGDQLDHLAHRVRPLAAGVEGLPRRAVPERSRDRQVRGDRIVDVE